MFMNFWLILWILANFKIDITFDCDVLRRWFLNRWKALTLSFPSVQESTSEDITIESYGDFKFESPISEYSWKITKTIWFLYKTRFVWKCWILWFLRKFRNRRPEFEIAIIFDGDVPRFADFCTDGKLRLSAFHRLKNQRLRISPSKVMAISKFYQNP